MNKDQLTSKIEKCFFGMAYPGDDDLTVHPLGLDESFYEAIKGKSYKEIDAKVFNEHNDCIGLLTPKGFQYYLPGFLLADLTLENSAIFSQLSYWLSVCQKSDESPIRDISGIDWLKPRIDILTVEQKYGLLQYFEFYKNNNLMEEEMDDVDTVIKFITAQIDPPL